MYGGLYYTIPKAIFYPLKGAIGASVEFRAHGSRVWGLGFQEFRLRVQGLGISMCEDSGPLGTPGYIGTTGGSRGLCYGGRSENSFVAYNRLLKKQLPRG